MLAIGIDPGTAICGFGLVEMVGNKLTPIHYGAVFTDKDMLPELRLKKIYDELSVLLDEYRPDLMSVEQLFFNRNVTTAIMRGQARGVAAFDGGQPRYTDFGIYTDADQAGGSRLWRGE